MARDWSIFFRKTDKLVRFSKSLKWILSYGSTLWHIWPIQEQNCPIEPFPQDSCQKGTIYKTYYTTIDNLLILQKQIGIVMNAAVAKWRKYFPQAEMPVAVLRQPCFFLRLCTAWCHLGTTYIIKLRQHQDWQCHSSFRLWLRADDHIRLWRGSEGESSCNPRRHGHSNENLRQIRPPDFLFRCPDVRANGSKYGQVVPDDLHLETIDEEINQDITVLGRYYIKLAIYVVPAMHNSMNEEIPIYLCKYISFL